MEPTLAISAPYGVGRAEKDLGQPYDDLKDLESTINYECPIKSIRVSWGWVIDGISVTYNTIDGTTVSKVHGAVGGTSQTHTDIELSESENIIEVSGVQGEVAPNREWGCQVTRLDFTIFDSETGLTRSAGVLGTGQELDQETRQDILVRGPLVGLKGIADNSAGFVGLNTVQFYTVPPV